MRRNNRLASRLALVLSLLATATARDVRPAFADSVCTVVKLTLGQTAALEREAFNAQLVLTNNQADAPLTNLSVTISIKDSAGNPVNTLFFNKVTDLGGVTAVDGSGTMQPASQATINWLIIPSPGAGGASSAGANYNVSAQISYVAGGVPSTNSTQDAGITVVPQPLLAIEYALPFEVFGVDPFTLTGSTEPFPLGLRVTNVGAGTATNFQVTSAQPTITDNKQGLPISFQILGTFVGSNPLSVNTLTIPFGNIAPGATSLAAWDMTSSYSGRFIDFTVGFTHAAELGGALTSLIQGVSTYTLIKDVLDDQPGHDAQFDLLVNTTTARSAMEANYQNGLEPQPDSIMESDRPGLIPVTNIPAHLTGSLSGSNAVVSFAYDQPLPANAWVHSSIPFPQGADVTLASVIRSDGKVINPRNAWIAKHIDKLTNTRTYFLHVLDYSTGQQNGFAMAFNAGALITPPDPISNLSAAAATPGGLALNWTATGDAGSAGTIVGGQYAIYASTNLAAAPSVSSAMVVFSTATPPLASQGYSLDGLLGNTTYQVAVFLANSGGQFSAASNSALALTLANPPTSARIAATGPTSFSLVWSTTANGPGTLYEATASSAAAAFMPLPGAYVADQSSAVFSGLSPNTLYYAALAEQNSALVVTPAVVVATATTLALPPTPAVQAVVSASSSTLTVQWQYGANPADTEFMAELATAPGQVPAAYASGWVHSSSFAFVGLSAQTTYYGRAKARSRAGVETAYIDLGAVRTPAFSITPQSGAAGAVFALSGAAFGPYAGANTRVRFGTGGETASITTWNSARITGTVPADLTTGTYTVLVERQNGASVTTTVGGTFAVLSAAPLTGTTLALSPADGDQVLIATPTIIASYAAALGVDTASVHLALDGASVPVVVTASSASFVPPSALSEGTHTVTASVADLGANVATAASTFLVDTIAPATSLQVDGLTVSATALTVVSTDTFGLAASDEGSGIADTVYLLDVDPNSCDFSGYVSTAPAGTCANPYYEGPFVLSAGTHTIAFYSDDGAGNSEDYHLTAFTVLSPVYAAGSADDVASLLSPVSGEQVTAVSASSEAVAASAAQRLTAATSYYDLSPSGVQFNPPATLSFRFDPSAFSTATLAIFTFNGVAWDSAAISGQSVTLLSSSSVQVSGLLAHASLYGVFSIQPADLLPPRTTLEVGAPSYSSATLYVSASTTFTFAATDDRLTVGDGAGTGAVLTYSAIDVSTYSVNSGTFAFPGEGRHRITFYSVDDAGNAEQVQTSTVVVDATAPTVVLTSTGGLFVLAAEDPVSNGESSGLAGIRYLLDASTADCVGVAPDTGAPAGTCANPTYAGLFGVSLGTHSLSYQAFDRVGNGSAVYLSSIVSNGLLLTWTGGAAGEWNLASNWNPAQVPGLLDEALIDSASTVTASGAAISFRSLMLGDATGAFSPVLIVATGTVSAGDVTVGAGATWRQETAVPVVVASMTVLGGGLLTHSFNGAISTQAFKLDLFVSGTFELRAGATVLLDARGFSGSTAPFTNGFGPGHGTYLNDSSGAGYGGYGGESVKGLIGTVVVPGAPGGPPYGSATYPTDLGSGGGGGYNNDPPCSGSGGGALILWAGRAVINGTVSANGGDSGACAASGGSGGTINIQASSFAGTGTLRANGGSAPLSDNQGAGAGGRIWAQGIANSTFAGACQVNPGTVPPKFPVELRGDPAQAGTAFCSALPPAPVIASLTSDHAPFGTVVTLTINGSGFLIGAVVKLSKAGQPDITGTNVRVLSSTQITAGFALTTGSAGIRDLVVTNTDTQSATLSDAFTIQPNTVYWTGLARDGRWNTAGNWFPARVPGPGDDVLIDSSAVILAVGDAVNFKSLLLGDASAVSTPTLVMATVTASGGAVTVSSGSTWLQETARTISLAAMTVQSGGALTHLYNGAVSSQPYKLDLAVSGTFDLQPGAMVLLDRKGYAGAPGSYTNGFGPGHGTYYIDSSGAGYGGYGGDSSKYYLGTSDIPRDGARGGAPYGSALNPTDIGSGGGGASNNNPPCSGSGGGAFILTAGTASINGLISANGGNSGGCAASGGSGGSINIRATNLMGSGVMRAAGGNSPLSDNQGGGGGGRIWAQGSSLNGFSGSCIVSSGTVAPKNPAVLRGQPADAGTGFCSTLPPAPSISAVDPSSATDNAPSLAIVVSGTGFLTGIGTTAKLSLAGQPDNVSTNVVVQSASRLTAFFDLRGQAPGLWSVNVVNPDGQSAAPAGAFSLRALAASTTTVAGNPELTVASFNSGVSVVQVSTASGNSAVALASAAASGLRLVSDLFDILPVSTFTPPGIITFRFDPAVVTDTSTLAIYRFDGVSWSSTTVPNQIVFAGTNPYVSANILYTSLWGLFLQHRDVLPPRTFVQISSPSFGAGPTFIGAASSIAFTSTDDATVVGDGQGFGVGRTYFSLDGGAFQAYDAPLHLSTEGAHALSWYSADIAGNVEAPHELGLDLDTTPPQTRVLVDGLQASTASVVLISTDAVSFSTTDAGSGVASTRYAIDASTLVVAAGAFTLPVGTHTLAFQSIDNVGNQEGLLSVPVSVLAVDTTPPSLRLVPADGGAVNAAEPTLLADYSDDGRGIDVSSVRLNLDGIDVTTAAAVAASSAAYVPPFALSQATHTLAVQVADLAGNRAASTATFLVDSIPPATTLFVNGLASGATQLVLISTDAVGFAAADGGSGAVQTRYALDASSSEVVYASTFSLVGGTHTLSFRSVDHAGNVETMKTVFLDVLPYDVTPPFAMLSPIDRSTVTTESPEISAAYGDAGRGVDPATVRLVLDGVDVTSQSSVTASSAIFTPSSPIAQGTHTVTARLSDYAGNEASAASTFLVDSIPPSTTLFVDGLARSATSLVLISTDAVGLAASDAGTGVAQILYALDGGSQTVYLSTFSLAVGAHRLAYHGVDAVGNAEAERFVAVAVLAADSQAPSLALAPIDGSTVTTASPSLTASYSDLASGVDPTTFRLVLDGFDVTPQSAVASSSAVFVPPAALSQGLHLATASISDLAGNRALAAEAFFIDSLPPLTTLLADGLPSGATSLVLVSTDVLGFAATDAGTGVAKTLYALDGGSQTVYVSTFSLAAGEHALSFYSLDGAGNAEAPTTASLLVRSTSTDAPPLVRLDFPGTSGLGVERAVGGIVSVRGQVSDENVRTWTLEAAPGVSVSSGYATLASGTTGVTGLIAAWNTASASGYQTLRLSAVDASGNAASTSAVVYVGKPIFDFAIGRKDADVIVGDLKDPAGIAVRSDGKIWVSANGRDRLLLLTPSGAVVTEVINPDGLGALKGPQGLDTDSLENVYVADTAGDRVLKLSPDGSHILLDIGRKNGKGRPKTGSGPGEFKNPKDVAVDSDGEIYVADTGNNRIQVLDSSGVYVRQWSTNVTGDSDIRAVVVTAAGVWVSDSKSASILLFSRDGTLLDRVDDSRSAVGELTRTRGLAADRLGSLYVVEPNRDRAQKFDPNGYGQFAFGTRQDVSRADRQAERYLTQPTDAAVAPDGSIWIADTGRDRVVRYVLPAPGAGVAEGSMRAAGVAVGVTTEAEPVSRAVPAVDGAPVYRDDGTGVEIPRGALSQDLAITVAKAPSAGEARVQAARTSLLAPAADAVQYGPEGTRFSAPVKLVLAYDPGEAAYAGLDEDQLQVHYWNPLSGSWQPLPSTVDRARKTVSAATDHFSIYQVFGRGIGVAAADSTFGLKAAYAFPNPAHAGAVTIRVQPGLADSVSVRIYDVSGRKVHESSDFSMNPSFDDGNGLGALITYDHVWRISGVGSGIYTYAITAKRAGNADIHKTGRIGVAK